MTLTIRASLTEESVTISRRAFRRLLAAEEACFRLLDWVTHRPIRSMEDVYDEWNRRDEARAALQDWARLAQDAADGPPGLEE